MKKYCIIIAFMVLLASCANQVKTASSDRNVKAKSLMPPKDKALIFVMRPTILGKPFAHEISLDGKKIGSTCGYYYVYTFASPGKHKLTASADNTGELEITVEGGKIYYVEQSVYPMVWKGGVSLSLCGQADCKKKLDECELSDDNLAGM